VNAGIEFIDENGGGPGVQSQAPTEESVGAFSMQ
jgi:hypothetical protein